MTFPNQSFWIFILGHHMFALASSGASGDNCEMKSPEIASGSSCLSFAYHLNGYIRLAVAMEWKNKTRMEVFSKMNLNNSYWITEKIAIPSSGNVRLVFIATKSFDAAAHVAVDDVILKPGGCAPYKGKLLCFIISKYKY